MCITQADNNPMIKSTVIYKKPGRKRFIINMPSYAYKLSEVKKDLEYSYATIRDLQLSLSNQQAALKSLYTATFVSMKAYAILPGLPPGRDTLMEGLLPPEEILVTRPHEVCESAILSMSRLFFLLTALNKDLVGVQNETYEIDVLKEQFAAGVLSNLPSWTTSENLAEFQRSVEGWRNSTIDDPSDTPAVSLTDPMDITTPTEGNLTPELTPTSSKTSSYVDNPTKTSQRAQKGDNQGKKKTTTKGQRV
jgi:hypothetical protein